MCTYVVIATVPVALSVIAVVTVTAGLLISALSESSLFARMGSVSSGDGVGLPDVHLGAASTDLARSGIRVGVGGVPALNVGLSVDVLDVVGALSIAVSGSELGTGLVVALVDATIGGHLNEVKSAVQTAGQLGNVNIEGELLADDVEHLVLGVRLHQVGTGTNVSGVGALGDELQGELVAAGGDTVGACEVSLCQDCCILMWAYQSSQHRR